MKRREKRAEEGREIRRGKQKILNALPCLYISTCNSQEVQSS
jgi:hypothetical protein